MKQRTVYIILVVLCLIFYGNTIGNKYSMDDDFVLPTKENLQKSLPEQIGSVFTSHYSDNEKSRYEYRPIVKLTFVIENAIWGNNPHASHSINLILFILTILLLYKLLFRLFGQEYPWLAFFAVVLFAAHPIHTEVVASLKNRDELLSFFFSILASWFAVRYFDTNKWYLIPLAIVVFALAYFSKSSALVFAALIPLILWFAGMKQIKKMAISIAILIVIVWFARWLPKSILADSHRAMWEFENPLYGHHGILYRIGTGLVALLFYIRLLIVPYPFKFYYGFDTIPLTHFPDLLSIVSLLIHIALVVVAIRFIRKKHPIAFAILFYLIAISMFSNIVKPAVGIVAERYIYAASLGFCIALAYLLLAAFKYQRSDLVSWLRIDKGLRLVMIALLFIYGARTISRNTVWRDHLTLYYNDIGHCQKSFKANLLIANTLQSEIVVSYNNPKYANRNAQYLKDADMYFNRALAIYDQYANAWNSYGSLQFMFYNNYEKASGLFKKAVELDPLYTEALFNLAFSFEKLEKPDSAEMYYNTAIASNPKYDKAYIQLGNLYLSDGDTLAFIDVQEQLKLNNPLSDAPWVNLGNYYLSIGDTSIAFSNWEKAAELGPANPPLLLNLSNYFLRIGNTEKYNKYNNMYNSAIREQRKQMRNQ